MRQILDVHQLIYHILGFSIYLNQVTAQRVRCQL